MSERIYRLPVLLASLSLVACGDLLDPNNLDDPLGLNKLAVIELKAEDGRTQIAVNQSVRLIAEGRSANGGVVSLPSPQWSSSDAAIATVATDGTVTGKATGEATITVSQNDKKATLKLRVQGALHGGQIEKDETWRAADNPHIVEYGVFVSGTGTPTLTIEAGVVVRFEQDTTLAIGVTGDAGRLKVLGTEEEPVLFTANSGHPQPGHYDGLAIGSAGSAQLEHLTVEYSGRAYATGYEGCVQFLGENTKPVVKHLTIRDCADFGIALYEHASFGAGSTDITIEDSDAHAMYIGSPNAVGTLPPNLAFSGNQPDAVFVYAGDVTRTQTWFNRGVPYIIDGGWVYVSGTGRPVLTIEPGTTLRFGNDSGLNAGVTGDAGEIKAIGTAEAPIVFTADAAEPQPGHWGGLVFGRHASSVSRIEHALVEYAGGENGTGYDSAAIAVMSDKGGFVRNTAINHSAGFGILRVDLDSKGFATDFTAPALGNSFSDNQKGDQSAVE